MGAVYEATHLRLRQQLAVKVLDPNLATSREFQMRFEREARAAALLSSPHAVKVFDVDTTDGFTYLVMELLTGNDLGTEAERGPIPSALLVDWIVQTCSALQEAHANRIVHRDIKPANIFLCDTTDGRIA